MAELPPRLECSKVVTTKQVDNNVEGQTMGCLSCVSRGFVSERKKEITRERARRRKRILKLSNLTFLT